MDDAARGTRHAAPPDPGPRLVRVFLAVEGNAAVRAAVAAAQAALRRRGEPPVRWTHPADAHVTLQFFGNVRAVHLPEIEAAAAPVAARHAPFLLRVGDVGAFPSVENPRTLWLDIAGQTDALLRLQRDLANAMLSVPGVVADRKAFRPHLTLGRAESRRDAAGASATVAALARPLAVAATPWPVGRFVLMRSLPASQGGKRYTALSAFGLGEMHPTPRPPSLLGRG